MNSDFLIREWNPSDSVSALTRLLHDAYAPLAAKGFRFLASHQDDTMTLRRLSEGWSFVLERDREVIGTISLRGPDAGSECEWYCRPDVFSIGQFAVRPDCQGQGFGSRLLSHGEASARQWGAVHLALDTAEGAAELLAWYARLEFQLVGTVCWPETNYRSKVLSKRLLS